mgnify:CR=1 FL=1
MPRACGSVANWNKTKRECHTLSQRAPQNRQKPHVAPEKEACAVWLCKGNVIRWKKQFKVGEMDKHKGKIQRPLGPAKPKAKKAEVVELKEPEEDDASAGGKTEADGNGNADKEEAGGRRRGR